MSFPFWLLVIWVKGVLGGIWMTGWVVSRFVRVEPWKVERPWLLTCHCFSCGFKELFQSWEIASPRPHICSVMIDFHDKGSVVDLLSQISIECESHNPCIIWISSAAALRLLPWSASINSFATKGHLPCLSPVLFTIHPLYARTYIHIQYASLKPLWCLIIKLWTFCRLYKAYSV